MKPQRIQRKRTKGWKMPPNTVYVGRPTRWGNQFEIVEEKGRWPGYGGFAVYEEETLLRGYYEQKEKAAKAAVEEFTEYSQDPRYRELVKELRGKNLACWCPLSQPCHADILLELANR